LGYEQSETDLCVFRRILGDRVYFITVYVNDLLIFATQDELDRLKLAFTEQFRWMTMEIGKMHSYLGMQLAFEVGWVKINMTYYLEKVLKGFNFNDLRPEVLPGKKNLFASSLDSPLLSEGEKASSHTVIAKLLYLCRRSRSDIITAVGFLCTRVQGPTIEDNMKLQVCLDTC
jgi:hypothetical protein